MTPIHPWTRSSSVETILDRDYPWCWLEGLVPVACGAWYPARRGSSEGCIVTLTLLVVGALFALSWAVAFFAHSLATVFIVVFVVFVVVFVATIAGHRIRARLEARKSSRLVSSWVSQTPRD